MRRSKVRSGVKCWHVKGGVLVLCTLALCCIPNFASGRSSLAGAQCMVHGQGFGVGVPGLCKLSDDSPEALDLQSSRLSGSPGPGRAGAR